MTGIYNLQGHTCTEIHFDFSSFVFRRPDLPSLLPTTFNGGTRKEVEKKIGESWKTIDTGIGFSLFVLFFFVTELIATRDEFVR